jgi:hypothetical protein
MNDLPTPGPAWPPEVVAEPDAEPAECLVLTAPAWFARDDFLDWRQGRAEGRWCGPACWLPQDRRGDYTDVFLTFDRGRPLDPGPADSGMSPRRWAGCKRSWKPCWWNGRGGRSSGPSG